MDRLGSIALLVILLAVPSFSAACEPAVEACAPMVVAGHQPQHEPVPAPESRMARSSSVVPQSTTMILFGIGWLALMLVRRVPSERRKT